MENNQIWDCRHIIVNQKTTKADVIKKGSAKVVKQEKIKPKFWNKAKGFSGIVKKPEVLRGIDEGPSHFQQKTSSKQKLPPQPTKKKHEWALNKDLAMEFSLLTMLNYLKSTYNPTQPNPHSLSTDSNY